MTVLTAPRAVFATLAFAALAACSSSSSSPSSPSPSPSSTTTATLSSQFTTNCGLGTCHGSTGKSLPSGSSLTTLDQTTYTTTQWDSAVRNGISGTAMVAFSTTTYTTANEQADYTVLTGKAW